MKSFLLTGKSKELLLFGVLGMSYFVVNSLQAETPSEEEEFLEIQYLIADNPYIPPPNCCVECLWCYCGAYPCVKGLMRQQLLKKDKPDPMSQENAGSVAGWCYCCDGCYDCCFPCVLTESCLNLASVGIGTKNESEAALTKQIQQTQSNAVEIQLIEHVAPKRTNIGLQLHGNCCWSPLYRIGYVIKKNEENKKNATNEITEQDGSSPFISSFHHPPGVKEIEFLIQ